MSRRDELLAEARRKRLRWVSDAGDPDEAPLRGEKQLWDTEVARSLPATKDVFALVALLVGDLESDAHFDLPGELLLLDDAPVAEYDNKRSHYAVFLDKLMHPRASDLVRQLETFASKFNINNLVGVREQLEDVPEELDVRVTPVAAAIHSFVRQMARHMRDHDVFRRESEAEFSETEECIEKFVSYKLYDQLFNPTAMQQEQDRQLAVRLQSLSFLTPTHLDLDPNLTEEDFQRPVELLRAVERKNCARDKIQCIVDMNRAIQELLKHPDGSDTGPSADEVLPVLIYVVKLAAPRQLQSQLQFIQEFRHPDKLMSEAGYVLTCILSAVHFLQTVRADQLSISRTDFEEKLQTCAQEIDSETRPRFAMGHEENGFHWSPEILNVAEDLEKDDDVEVVRPSSLRRARLEHSNANESASMLSETPPLNGDLPEANGSPNPIVQSKKSIRKVLQDAHLLLERLEYRGVQPDDVRVVDIPGILGEHRALVYALTDLTSKVDTLLVRKKRHV